MKHQNHTSYSTLTLTSLQEQMIGERKRDVAVIHSAIHNFYVTHSLKYRKNDRRKNYVVVIHSAIHDLLLLVCNSLAEV